LLKMRQRHTILLSICLSKSGLHVECITVYLCHFYHCVNVWTVVVPIIYLLRSL